FASLFGQLQAGLKAEQETNRIELNIANALWIQEGFPIIPAFLNTATEQYQASVGQADFITDADVVRQNINDWVAQQTKNKIQNILSPGSITPDIRLVLANAIYFLGKWTVSFQETNTAVQPFFLSRTSMVEAPLMHQPLLIASNGQAFPFNYMQSYPASPGPPSNNDFQALELPYGSNQLSMLILLPSEMDGLELLEQQLSADFLSNLLARMAPAPVEIFLPRFTLESSFNLGHTLESMGMPDAFDPWLADFSGIDGRTDLYVDFVVHKAWGEIKESGTEAAAATVIGAATSATPPPHAVFRADHPFLFLIRDTRTGSILFMGRLTNPSGSGPAASALTLKPSLAGLRVCWPYSWHAMELQQSTDLTHWIPSVGVSTDGTNYFVNVPREQPATVFFRLERRR
ncbi:MAG TPA: serpin family protein, partial [Verrucomicrobiae bacterium]|nr:serpin family protein [Verrucomicrobiae bacterium]